MTLNIYLAADAVMYLPIWVAKEKEIFSTLLTDTTVNLIPAQGDYDAIKRMCQDNMRIDHDLFAIAVADPNSIINIPDARIIGALIDRLSFWGVSPRDIDCHIGGINRNDFNKIIYYNDNLITGNKIGIQVRSEESIRDFQLVDNLGEEFDYLSDNSIIISPDLLKIAHKCVKEEAYINYHFATGDRYLPNTYLTTTIITSQTCISGDREHKNSLVLAIEAIQKAKTIIYSSRRIAKEILLKMDCMNRIEDEYKDEVADFIIQTINNDRIYPSDLNISQKQLENTNRDLPFEQVVNDIVLQSERNIASQFGINVQETFAKEVNDERDRVRAPLQQTINKQQETILSQQDTIQLQQEIISKLESSVRELSNTFFRRMKKWIAKYWFHLIFWPSLIYAIFWGICRILNIEWTKTVLANILATVFAFPLIINVITGGWRKESKQSIE